MKHIFFLFAGIASFQAHAQNTFPANGNVGVGTTSPQAKIQIGTVTFPSPFNNGLHIGSATSNSYVIVGQQNERNLIVAWLANATINNAYALIETYAGSNPLVLQNAGGNVGIGTTTPQAKLAVNGNILAKRIKVTQTGWPDYVFDSTYHLRPLKDVEQFIQQYKHLPEVTPATEIEKDGLDLGDNQVLLLKKIEELTLYIIEQSKRLEEQNKRIEALEKKLAGKQ